jgi:hypothetical protein
MATGMFLIRSRIRIGRRGILITILTHTTTHSTIILISFSRSLFRSTIHTGMTMIILIVFAIIIGILIMVTLIPEGSLVSLEEVGSRSEG